MHKISKGSYGYIRNARIRTLVFVILLYVASLGIFFGAAAYFHTRQNWFSILAILIILPAARYTVNLVMLYRAIPCSVKAHHEISQHIGHLEGAWELYLTSEKKSFAVSHLAVAGKSIACLTEDPKCSAEEGEQHIRKMLQANGFHGYTVKIFSSLPRYLDRLDQMNRLESSDSGAPHQPMIGFLESIAL